MRLRGLKPSVLLDLMFLTGMLQEHHGPLAHREERAEGSQHSELQGQLEEDIARAVMDGEDLTGLIEGKCRQSAPVKCDFPEVTDSLIPTKDLFGYQEVLPSPSGTCQQARPDIFALELHAIRVSYLLLGALKSLSVILSSGKFTDILLLSKAPGSAGRSSAGMEESAELRLVLQLFVRSTVKWAARTCPIKQEASLADLERAQIMIFNGAINRLQEDSGAMEPKGKTQIGYWLLLVIITGYYLPEFVLLS